MSDRKIPSEKKVKKEVKLDIFAKLSKLDSFAKTGQICKTVKSGQFCKNGQNCKNRNMGADFDIFWTWKNWGELQKRGYGKTFSIFCHFVSFGC